jgi:hypothetical protein
VLLYPPPPLDEHGYPGCQLPCIRQIVGDQHQAESPGQARLKVVPETARRDGIEAGERLVQKQHSGVVQRAASNGGSLEETAAEPLGKLTRRVGQTRRLERRPCHRLRPLQEIEPRRERKVLQQGQVIVEHGLVGEKSHGATSLGRAPAQRLAQQANLAGGGPHESGQEPQQSCFAGPIRADDCQGLTRPE